MSFVRMLEKINSVITAPHCNYKSCALLALCTGYLPVTGNDIIMPLDNPQQHTGAIWK